MLFKNKNQHVHITDLCIGNNVITCAGRNCVEEYVRFLGVLIDDELSFVGHINKLKSKLNSGLYALSTCNNLVPLNIRLLIYRGLIVTFNLAPLFMVLPIQNFLNQYKYCKERHFAWWQWPNTMPTLILFSKCTTFLSYQI